MKKAILNGTLIVAFVLSFWLTTNAQKVGGYKTVEVDDERVIAAADFAVSKRVETNTEQEGLKLNSIDKAEMQVVAGINYRLCLSVGLEDESQQVKVVVYQNFKKDYSLTNWTVEACAESNSNNLFFDNYLQLLK